MRRRKRIAIRKRGSGLQRSAISSGGNKNQSRRCYIGRYDISAIGRQRS